MPPIDLSAVEQIIREAAQAEIMPRFRKLAAGDVEMKGVNDPVTVADKETERHLSERFKAYLPGSAVLGEEAFAQDKAVMAHLDAAQPVWIIDPIDGTRNFVAGVPEFAVMVALAVKRQVVASWIHDPNSGDTIMAEQGGGVWLRGKKLTLATRDPSISTVGLVGARVKKLISDPSVMPSASAASQLRRDSGPRRSPEGEDGQGNDVPLIEIGSCAGFDYPRLFTGEVQFADAPTARAGFLLYRHTNAWDHAPGLFLHAEGGGYSADWQGKPYDMSNPRAGLLYARDRETWEHLHAIFEPLMQHALRKAP